VYIEKINARVHFAGFYSLECMQMHKYKLKHAWKIPETSSNMYDATHYFKRDHRGLGFSGQALENVTLNEKAHR